MWKRENWLFLCAILGAVAAVVKILEYFGLTPQVVMPVAHSLSGLIWAGVLFVFSVGFSIYGIYTANGRRRDLERQLTEKTSAAQRRDELIGERDQKINGLERENHELRIRAQSALPEPPAHDKELTPLGKALAENASLPGPTQSQKFQSEIERLQLTPKQTVRIRRW